MWNIIKSQLYQLTHDKFTDCVLLFFCGIYTAIACSELSALSPLNGGMACAVVSEWFVVMSFYMTVMLVGRICGWDFNDKTINYEVLSGHKKSEIFFSRAVCSLLLILLLSVLMLGVPAFIGTLVGGWGPNLAPSDMLLRSVLALLVMERFVAEIVLISFLIRNCFAGMLIGGILPAVSAILPLLADQLLDENKNLYVLSSLASLLELLSFENARQGFVDGKDITVYLAGLDTPFILLSAATSIAMIAVCMTAGYFTVKKRDM